MRTAEAIKKAAGRLCPEADVAILDTFRYASPFLEKIVLGAYMEMLKMSPIIYGYLYRQAEHGRPLSGRGKMEFNRILNILAAPKLEEYIKIHKPEIIVCTHPFPLGIACWMKKRGIFQGPVVATITDFTIHSYWIFPEVDLYLVGSEVLKKQCEKFGIETERVQATGIPIDPEFDNSYDKCEIKKELSLERSIPAILINGGGLGMGPLESAVKRLSKNRVDCQIIVVTGTNSVLKEKLERLAPELTCRVKIFGYVNNIHKLMAASDMMVGKAGGLTCAEAMATGLPVFIVDPLPGQEERNTEFITSMGAGVRVKEKNLAHLINEYIKEPYKIMDMAEKAKVLGKPKAAFDAVRIMSDVVNN